jgi:hypothetical protein
MPELANGVTHNTWVLDVKVAVVTAPPNLQLKLSEPSKLEPTTVTTMLPESAAFDG